MWVPCCLAGMLANFQVRRLAAYYPEVAGGTPNLTARLLPDHPFLARYAAFGYFQGWASAPALTALIISGLMARSLPHGLTPAAMAWLQVGIVVLGFFIALAGTRALSILHFFFLVPALGLLLTFCIQGRSGTPWFQAVPVPRAHRSAFASPTSTGVCWCNGILSLRMLPMAWKPRLRFPPIAATRLRLSSA